MSRSSVSSAEAACAGEGTAGASVRFFAADSDGLGKPLWENWPFPLTQPNALYFLSTWVNQTFCRYVCPSQEASLSGWRQLISPKRWQMNKIVSVIST